jgi:hypothetical protein
VHVSFSINDRLISVLDTRVDVFVSFQKVLLSEWYPLVDPSDTFTDRVSPINPLHVGSELHATFAALDVVYSKELKKSEIPLDGIGDKTGSFHVHVGGVTNHSLVPVKKE